MKWLLLLWLVPLQTFGQWTTEDRMAGVTALTFTVIDWGQTRYIAEHQQFYEINPILGMHPSMAKVNTYFAGALIGGTILTFALPEKDRKWFLGGVTVLELGVTAHNANIGIRVNF